jgi:hypothetical protein
MKGSSEPGKTVRASKVEEMRKRHPRFVYDSFSLVRESSGLRASFHFILEPDVHFRPDVVVELACPSDSDSVDPSSLSNFVFHLGLVEMLSYWKAACSPEIVVRAGSLDPNQIGWWTNLLLNGMGEYFYVNEIDSTVTDLVRIDAAGKGSYPGPVSCQSRGERPLVLASGGKDTAVTLRLLQEAGIEFDCLLLNPTQAALNLVRQSGCRRTIVARRAIDPTLLRLNEAGYLNGHTPFSAYLSFLGVACGAALGHRYVIASNERSSSEGNVQFLDGQVNHQYSKSLEFEGGFRAYASAYLTPEVDYFSLLRPLYEIQIIWLFSDYPEFFQVFRSCNRGQREESWCGKCPKCVSIFTLSYPFVDQKDLIKIFGKNLFEEDSTVDMLMLLTGIGGQKPFECVGTFDETIAALYLSVAKAKRLAGGLPRALRWAEREVLPVHPDAALLARRSTSDWGDEHHLPPEYAAALKSKLGRKIAAGVG